MDAQRLDGEWSVEKVLLFIINNCRSWRGEGMKVELSESILLNLEIVKFYTHTHTLNPFVI